MNWTHYLLATLQSLWYKEKKEIPLDIEQIELLIKRNGNLVRMNTDSDDGFFFEIDWYDGCLYWNYKVEYLYYHEEKDFTIKYQYLEYPVFFEWDPYKIKNTYDALWEKGELYD